MNIGDRVKVRTLAGYRLAGKEGFLVEVFTDQTIRIFGFKKHVKRCVVDLDDFSEDICLSLNQIEQV